MDIYNILQSKPHKSFHLKRYITFIQQCQQKDTESPCVGSRERHHICPKAKDMFPEYRSFSQHPWNLATLTPRQHFIAHIMLWKAFPNIKSLTYCIDRMRHTAGVRCTSKLYEKYKKVHSTAKSEFVRQKIAKGEYHMQKPDNPSRIRVENGTHHFLDSNVQRNINLKKVENGTHPFVGGEIARTYARKRVADGTHHFLSGDISVATNRRRLADNTHNFQGFVQCVDPEGNTCRVAKEDFYAQTEPKTFVHNRSKEGQKRLNLRQHTT